MDERSMHDFIDTLALPRAAKDSLSALLPRTYLGLAPRLAHRSHASS
jgi:hypothetical protein